MARALLPSLLSLFGVANATFFQAFSSDVKTGHSVDFLLSDSQHLPADGTSLRLSIGSLNVTHFSAGAEGKQCDGDQLDVGAVLTVQDGVAPFRPRIRIQKHTEEQGWETLKMGLLGVTVDLDFTLQQLAGPQAPEMIVGGHNYVFNLKFKDAEIDTPLGKKTACVNLATREVVAKASPWKWFYFNLADDLGRVFYMNMLNGDSVVASIKVCLLGPGQCQ